jgi:hypothetical protein
MIRFALPVALLLLAACQSEPDALTAEGGGQAEGEVLGGSISDEMIPLEQLRSQAPLAPPGPVTPGRAASVPNSDGAETAPAAPAPETPVEE